MTPAVPGAGTTLGPVNPNRPSRTAEIVAYMRATEALRPPEARILDDRYAAWFLGPLARPAYLAAVAGARVGVVPVAYPSLTTYIVARHRELDEALLGSLDAVEQIVLLGAGYDMRAARFADRLAEKAVYEVDHPATAARKEHILARHGVDTGVRRVTVDFQTQSFAERLVQAGFTSGAPTLFLWEGVSMYLRRDVVKGTLAALHELGGPRSVLALDFWQLLDAPDLVATLHRASAALLSLVGEPVTFGIHPEDAEPFLGRLGWTLVDLAGPDVLAQRYVRDGRKVYPANFVVRAVSDR